MSPSQPLFLFPYLLTNQPTLSNLPLFYYIIIMWRQNFKKGDLNLDMLIQVHDTLSYIYDANVADALMDGYAGFKKTEFSPSKPEGCATFTKEKTLSLLSFRQMGGLFPRWKPLRLSKMRPNRQNTG